MRLVFFAALLLSCTGSTPGPVATASASAAGSLDIEWGTHGCFGGIRKRFHTEWSGSIARIESSDPSRAATPWSDEEVATLTVPRSEVEALAASIDAVERHSERENWFSSCSSTTSHFVGVTASSTTGALVREKTNACGREEGWGVALAVFDLVDALLPERRRAFELQDLLDAQQREWRARTLPADVHTRPLAKR